MTIAAAVQWEVRSTATANNVNGGGFKAGASGTDFSQQNAAQYNLTGVTTAGADAILLSASAANDMVGNIAHIISGTNATAGWYEIISVVAGVSITLDRTCATGIMAAGVVNIGGALSLASTLDDDCFEAMEPGNTVHVKAGTYTLGEQVLLSKAGGASLPIKIIGYNAARNDNPAIANQPLFNVGANAFQLSTNWEVWNLRFKGTGTAVLTLLGGCKTINCQVINNSTTAGRAAIAQSGTDAIIDNTEVVSIRGIGVNITVGATATLNGNYVHHCNVGISSVSAVQSLSNNIIAHNVTAAYQNTSANASTQNFYNNTFYGAENKQGLGLDFATGCTDIHLFNNVIYGFATGVKHADTQSVGYDNYNNYYNNTADVSAAGQWQKGAQSIALAPAFTNVAQITGTAATTSNTGNTLIDATKTFVTSGVVAGRDYVHITSTSGTAGIYEITSVDSETQLTLGQAPGASSANVSFQIATGQNFSVGTNLKGAGAPGAFPGGYSTGYMDIGAVQRQEGGGASAIAVIGGF